MIESVKIISISESKKSMMVAYEVPEYFLFFKSGTKYYKANVFSKEELPNFEGVTKALKEYEDSKKFTNPALKDYTFSSLPLSSYPIVQVKSKEIQESDFLKLEHKNND